MKIFVTGGAGFIGNHLVNYLLKQNYEVTIFDDFSNSSKQKIKVFLGKGAKLVEGKITDSALLENSLNDFDVVIHLAAKIDVQESIKNPELYHKVNVIGTKNLLEACIKKGIKNVVAVSSAAVYGKPNILPLTESSPTSLLSPYGKTKVEMENLFINYAKNHDLNCITLRIFNVYGKGQTDAYAGVITKFMKNIQENQPLVIFGDGSNTRDFISIDDAIQAILKSIENIDGKKGTCYNIATGNHISINELASMMLKISGKNLKVIHDLPKEGDIKHSQTKIDKAQRELNFNPKVKLEEGLKQLLEV